MLRSLLERLSREKSLKRRLPLRFGRTPLYVSPDAQLKFLNPGERAFDSELLSVLSEHIREDSVVWDIGANVGVFSFAAASIAGKGKVLAVEADIWLAQLIAKSARLRENQALPITILPCAVSDRNGVAAFLIASRGRASNALEVTGTRSQSGGIREKSTVPTLTLDTLLEFFDSPTFVKIDVEGAEAVALRGAGRLLSETRPVIYIEVGAGANEAITSILSKAGYVLFDGSIPVQERAPIDHCAYNTLAMPREKTQYQSGLS
jgi:FkbM family methyltransferase